MARLRRFASSSTAFDNGCSLRCSRISAFSSSSGAKLSAISSAAFQMGETYTVKTKDYEKTFTLNENFTVVR